MSLSDDLKLKLEQQKAARISKESPVDKLLHTIYLGDRTIQQLGQKPIANGIKLNNAAVEIGDPMLPLAKGDVLRRVDNKNRNGGKALGSAQRTALERDGLANNRSNGLGDNGDPAPLNNPNNGTPKGKNPPPKGSNPPFGCEPPVQNCVWLNTAIAPNGYGSHGSVVLNNDGLELYLYCELGTTPPPDLGCDFNRKWKCVNGVCVQDANGVYASLAECQAALMPSDATGGMCAGVSYTAFFTYDVFQNNVFQFNVNRNPLIVLTGSVISSRLTTPSGSSVVYTIVHAGGTSNAQLATGLPVITVQNLNVEIEGSPNNCGNPPPSCP